jgi:hypothetical protein
MKSPFKFLRKKFYTKMALVLFLTLLVYFNLTQQRERSPQSALSSAVKIVPVESSAETFANDINADRLNRLFKILQNFENKHFANSNDNAHALNDQLDLISFNRIKYLKLNAPNATSSSSSSSSASSERETSVYERFRPQIDEYLTLNDENNLEASAKFVAYLRNKSEFYSFKFAKRDSYQVQELKVCALGTAWNKLFFCIKRQLLLK